MPKQVLTAATSCPFFANHLNLFDDVGYDAFIFFDVSALV